MPELRLPWKRETWHVSYWLTTVCFAFFILSMQDPVWAKATFMFEPHAAVHQLQLWRFLTYAFFFSGPVNFLLSVLFYFMLGSALEALWGSAQFLVFVLVSILGVSTMGAILNTTIPMGWGAIGFNLLVLYAIHFPEAVIYVWFVIPVKVKYLAAIAAAYLTFMSLTAGIPGLVMMLGTSSGLIYWAVRLRSGRLVRAAKSSLKAASTAVAPGRDPRAAARAAYARARALADGVARGTLQRDEQRALDDMKAAVVPAVNVCPAEYFAPTIDPCLQCNGFMECTLRSFGLLALPQRKAGGRTATGASDAIAAHAAREREAKMRARIAARALTDPEPGAGPA